MRALAVQPYCADCQVQVIQLSIVRILTRSKTERNIVILYRRPSKSRSPGEPEL